MAGLGMDRTKRKLRSWAFGTLANLGFGIRVLMGRLRGRPLGVGDFTLVEPGLFIGGRCDEPPAGTRAVLNVSPNRDEWTVEEYRWRPVPMSSPPTIEWVGEQVEFIRSCRAAGKIVFVHCDAGMDRSAMVVIAYLMRDRGWAREEALEFLQRKRGKVRPNPVFLGLLSEWEEAMGGRLFE
jgi:hypothetical protein